MVLDKQFLKGKTRANYELLMPAGDIEKRKYAIHLFWTPHILRWLQVPFEFEDFMPDSAKKAGKKPILV